MRVSSKSVVNASHAIADVVEDLAKGQPMDRLICGDVGFGKTEVALRAAFIAAMTGRQVALVAPTTLLVRQHYKNFVTRFKGFVMLAKRAMRSAEIFLTTPYYLTTP